MFAFLGDDQTVRGH